MADEELGEYILVKEDGNQEKSSWNYSGSGSATYPNGEIYEGNFKDGKKEGSGTYTYANGDKYVGQFQNDLKHGIGRLTYNEKGEYHGYFAAHSWACNGVSAHLKPDCIWGQYTRLVSVGLISRILFSPLEANPPACSTRKAIGLHS